MIKDHHRADEGAAIRVEADGRVVVIWANGEPVDFDNTNATHRRLMRSMLQNGDPAVRRETEPGDAIPHVHPNGTAGKDLLEQRLAVLRSLREAEEKMRSAWPNGRDFYTKGPDALPKAHAVWVRRIDQVRALSKELEAEAHVIADLS